MNLISRLVALERRQTQPDLTDTKLRERLRPVAMRLDLDLAEVVEETKRFIAMSDTEREAAIEHLRRELQDQGLDFDTELDEALRELRRENAL